MFDRKRMNKGIVGIIKTGVFILHHFAIFLPMEKKMFKCSKNINFFEGSRESRGGGSVAKDLEKIHQQL